MSIRHRKRTIRARAVRAILSPESRTTLNLLPRTMYRPLSTWYYGRDLSSDDRFSWQAGRVHALLFRLPAPAARVVCRPAVRKLLKVSTTDDHRLLVGLLADALEGGRMQEARSMARHLAFYNNMMPSIISDKYRLVCLRLPRVASTSIGRALRRLDPGILLLPYSTPEAFHRDCSWELENYFTFGFARHPLTRLRSCWKYMMVKAVEKAHDGVSLLDPYHGLTVETGFEEFCHWIVSPWGADAVANTHWASQHLTLVGPDGRPPNFIGNYENLENDWRTVLEMAGAPHAWLPLVNVSEVDKSGQVLLAPELLDLLHTRFERDYELGGYDPHAAPWPG